MRRLLAVISALAALTLSACSAAPKNEPTPVDVAPPSVSATAAPAPVSTAAPTAEPTPTAEALITAAPDPTPSPVPEHIAIAVCSASDYLNIRSSPDKNSEKVGELRSGELAYIRAYENGFALIETDSGAVGYASADYLMNLRGEPSVPVPMGDWALILINPTNLIPSGFSVELSDFGDEKLDSRIYGITAQMFADAKEDGVTLRLVSGYRSHDHQNRIFQKKVDSYIDAGYSREDAEREASTITARPDTSEHQTGLALDIVSDTHRKMDSTFADSDAYLWLTQNAHQYGFIMRYAADKQPLTNVIFEPWHWRFVGTDAAAVMRDSGICLEEYLSHNFS